MQYECCIIGAGPAGLGVALELVRHGITSILIIEKNKSVGGLSRTTVLGGARFDIGPHRFFSNNKEINAIWHDTLGPDFIAVSRLTRILYNSKYFDYPIRIQEILLKLGLRQSVSALFSFALSQFSKKKIISFEDAIIRKFGYKLYDAFFKIYTEKVWGIPCNQISAEWVEQRIKGVNVIEFMRMALLGAKNTNVKSFIKEFRYPILGAGQMYDAMCNKVLSHGVQLILDSHVVRVNHGNNSVKSVDILKADGNEINISAKHFFSSIPMSGFFRILNPADPSHVRNAADRLKYRDHITVDLLLGREKVFPDQWIYVHSPDIQMVRVTSYKNFSRAMVKSKNKTALSVEYFVSKNLGLWNKTDGFLIDLAISELEKLRLIKKSEVEIAGVVRETEAYPLYYIGYHESYALLKSRISQFSNLCAIGRNGMHRYNNQDHSLLSGILAARNYLRLSGSPYVLWSVDTENKAES